MGNRKIILRSKYPNLFDQVQEYIKYRYWHSGCIDEALDWCNLQSKTSMPQDDFEYILNSKEYNKWLINKSK